MFVKLEQDRFSIFQNSSQFFEEFKLNKNMFIPIKQSGAALRVHVTRRKAFKQFQIAGSGST